MNNWDFKGKAEKILRGEKMDSTTTLTMDAVDQKQQLQIDSNRIWLKVLMVVGLIIILEGGVLFYMVAQYTNCPHKDCPHHVEPAK